ncbi:hypothetical protein QE152_g25376 [Popillia japonica]|uniref:Uncharacterized protein n=1 Tax=Popillia japonica TaxID=7064 RepID=A0AAW1K176_POPJA
MKDMGKAKHCIGLNITYDKHMNGISLDQSVKFGMAECKPVTTPSDPNQKLSIDMCSNDETLDNVPYQEAVGSLLIFGTRN